jgi:50S ribosomal subunit-associated GTPase HflX
LKKIIHYKYGAIPVLLVVNKCDLVEDIEDENLEKYMQSDYL